LTGHRDYCCEHTWHHPTQRFCGSKSHRTRTAVLYGDQDRCVQGPSQFLYRLQHQTRLRRLVSDVEGRNEAARETTQHTLALSLALAQNQPQQERRDSQSHHQRPRQPKRHLLRLRRSSLRSQHQRKAEVTAACRVRPAAPRGIAQHIIHSNRCNHNNHNNDNNNNNSTWDLSAQVVSYLSTARPQDTTGPIASTGPGEANRASIDDQSSRRAQEFPSLCLRTHTHSHIRPCTRTHTHAHTCTRNYYTADRRGLRQGESRQYCV